MYRNFGVHHEAAYLMAHFTAQVEKKGQWDQIIIDLVERRTDPYSLAEQMMMSELGKADCSIHRGNLYGGTGEGEGD